VWEELPKGKAKESDGSQEMIMTSSVSPQNLAKN
jgi:hypothetical protein